MALRWFANASLGLVLGCASVPSVTTLESDWSRQALPAEGITIHATLWNPSLVDAATQGDRRSGASKAWAERYLNRTAFTVVIELEDRRPVLDAGPLLDPSGWSFGLSLNKGDDARRTDVATPLAVDLLLVDRFPTASGHHHHRIAMAVFFDGDLQESGETVALVVKPRLPEPEKGRSMIGARWADAGTTLRWRARPEHEQRSGLPEH